MIRCSNAARPTYVPRIRLWSNDPSLQHCQTNLCPKNQAMIQWSISHTLPDQPLSQELGYNPMIHPCNAARPTSVPRNRLWSIAARPSSVLGIRLWSNDPSLHRCQTNLYHKNEAMIQWSIAASLPNQSLSQKSGSGSSDPSYSSYSSYPSIHPIHTIHLIPPFHPIHPIHQIHPIHSIHPIHPINPIHPIHMNYLIHPIHPITLIHSIHPIHLIYPIHWYVRSIGFIDPLIIAIFTKFQVYFFVSGFLQSASSKPCKFIFTWVWSPPSLCKKIHFYLWWLPCGRIVIKSGKLCFEKTMSYLFGIFDLFEHNSGRSSFLPCICIFICFCILFVFQIVFNLYLYLHFYLYFNLFCICVFSFLIFLFFFYLSSYLSSYLSESVSDNVTYWAVGWTAKKTIKPKKKK